MNHSRLLCFILLATGALMSACQEKLPEPIERPRNPWVIRSVLDGKPRMVTLAMHEVANLAYDAENCVLRKVWRGGVHFNGAPYNGIKTVQPTSWGEAYWNDSLHRSTWQIHDRVRDTVIPIQFRGYGFVHNRITFHYEAEYASKQFLQIAERPEIEIDASGNPVLRRIFRTRSVPPSVDIRLLTEGGELALPANDTLHHLARYPLISPQSPPRVRATGNRGQYWISRSGCLTCHETEVHTVGPSWQAIAERYAGVAGARDSLARKVQRGGAGNWGKTPMNPHPHIGLPELSSMVGYVLSLASSQIPAKRGAARQRLPESPPKTESVAIPGHGIPLEAVHPAYDLSPARPPGFEPSVGGMDFLPDGRLVVSTWDSIGGIYLLEGVQTGDPDQISVKRIAAGLAEPLGLKVVGNTLFVLQKQELTELRDYDGDDIIDEYRSVNSSFGVSADFHEFSYGLIYKDDFFYANLGLAMRLMAHERQHVDRGKTVELSPFNSHRTLNSGLRQPNGIGTGPDGELFITENQGRWVPACKLIHVQVHGFEGCRIALGDSLPFLDERPPAVWLPQDEIGNSPGEPILMKDGPYRGQMLHGEVTHGGIKRVFLEKVNGVYQGCVFRFSQGLEAGINRLVWGPDGALYAGGVGMSGGWSHKEKKFGLQRLIYNDSSVFEMLAVRATPGGISITLTEAIAEIAPGDIRLEQWCYAATEQYGGPKTDAEVLSISEAGLSQDGRQINLIIPGLKEGYVVYIRLDSNLKSLSNKRLWSSESWYTLNSIPQAPTL